MCIFLGCADRSRPDWWDVALFTILAVLVAMTAVGVVKGRKGSELFQVIRGLKGLFSSRRASDDINKLLQTNMMKLRVRHFRLTLQLACFALLMWSVFCMLNILTGAQRANTMNADILMVAFQAVLSVAVAWPGSVTARSLDLYYGCLMLLIITVPLLSSKSHFVEATLGADNFLVLLLFVRRTVRIPFIVALHMVSGFVRTASLLAKGTDCFDNPGFFAAGQLAGHTVAVFCAHVLEMCLETSMLGNLQLEAVKEMNAAASALLRSCCEVVVELDEEGSIAGPATDLCSFLLLRGNRLEGTPLVDLICDAEEKEQFLERLAAPKLKDLGLAENMPVSMKDAWGTTLRLELMWFQYHVLGGTLRYRVGIREFADSTVTKHQTVSGRRGPQVPHSTAVDILVSPRTSVQSASVPETASVASGPFDDVAPMVILDCSPDSEGLPVMEVTTGFRARIGRVTKHSKFTKCLAKPRHFVRWVQNSVNCVLEGEEPPDCALVFNMPQGQVKAKCKIVRSLVDRDPETDDDEVSFDMSRVAFLFYDVRLCLTPGPGHSTSRAEVTTLKGTPRRLQQTPRMSL